MRGRGSDQGGRWPVGIWFALVGMSAGTVGSFALIGWTFTRGLYGGEVTAEPMEFESGSVVIEAEEAAPGGDAGAESGLEGLVEPGGAAEVEPSPVEPQAEPMPEPEPDPGVEYPAAEPPAPVEHGEAEAEGPELVPIEEESGRDCPPGEAVEMPEWDLEPDREGGEGPWLRPEFEGIELPPLD